MFSSLPVFAKIYLSVISFLLGLVMGSALNCLSYRIAHDQKWSSGRSVCPSCGHTLAARDLVPLFSWLFLKGKCRYCGAPVSKRYPITELCLALCYTAVLLRFGLSLHTLSCLVLVSCLFCLTLVDLDIQIIPDRFLIISAVVRLIELAAAGDWAAFGKAFIPALVIGGGVLVLSLVMDKVLKKESMGGGDIKLLFMLGLWFRLPCCLLLLIVACIVGLVVAYITIRAEEGKPFPFGPALSIAAFIVLLCGDPIVDLYLRLFL